MNIKVMLHPDGEDPDSFARKHNATEFQEYIAAHEVDFIRFKTNLLMSDAQGDPYKRSKVIKDIVESISVIPEAIVRSEYIKECSQMLHVEELILINEVAKLKRAKEEKGNKGQYQKDATSSSQGESNPSAPGSPTPTEHGAPELPPIGVDELPPTGNGDIPASHQPDAPSTPWDEHERGPLYAKERLIVQQLIRHGEKVMFVDEESKQEITVAEYVAAELNMDNITLTTPLFAEVLQELLPHIGEAGFTAERHFVTHANPALSRLAVDLIEEKYQLSKYHSKTQTIVSDADRLNELMYHLMIDYKHSLIEMELKNTLDLLRHPDVMADDERCLEVMSRYKELMEIKQQMAKHLGDRVIG
jgi:DNA primase